MAPSHLFLRRRAAAALVLQTRSTRFATAQFHSCPVRAAGKESALHNESRASEAEATKQESLRERREHGQSEWKDGLASDSESIVKADRGEMKDTKGTIDELQKETAKVAEREKAK